MPDRAAVRAVRLARHAGAGLAPAAGRDRVPDHADRLARLGQRQGWNRHDALRRLRWPGLDRQPGLPAVPRRDHDLPAADIPVGGVSRLPARAGRHAERALRHRVAVSRVRERGACTRHEGDPGLRGLRHQPEQHVVRVGVQRARESLRRMAGLHQPRQHHLRRVAVQHLERLAGGLHPLEPGEPGGGDAGDQLGEEVAGPQRRWQHKRRRGRVPPGSRMGERRRGLGREHHLLGNLVQRAAHVEAGCVHFLRAIGLGQLRHRPAHAECLRRGDHQATRVRDSRRGDRAQRRWPA